MDNQKFVDEAKRITKKLQESLICGYAVLGLDEERCVHETVCPIEMEHAIALALQTAVREEREACAKFLEGQTALLSGKFLARAIRSNQRSSK